MTTNPGPAHLMQRTIHRVAYVDLDHPGRVHDGS